MWPGPKPSTKSTTPTEIEVCLNQDVDRLLLRAQVLGANEQPMTSCVTHELLRVGRNPASWAIGTLRAFPLAYAERLPLGNYLELVSAVVGQSPNDQVPADETITVVTVDDWLDVATIQPLRHAIIDSDEPFIESSRLTFSAWNGEGGRLVVQTSYTPESGVPFESPLDGLSLYGADGINWYARSGTIQILEVGEGELRVQLSDVILEKSRTIDEPEVLRTLPVGSITGAVRRECRAPSPESVDSSWSAPYCARLREIGGF